ncbi:MAG TPA: hypothetical protein VII98_05820 [Solirubrobacteraceae bacterium]
MTATTSSFAGQAGTIVTTTWTANDPRAEEKVYPGAQHEMFNEINRDEVLDDVVDVVERSLAG